MPKSMTGYGRGECIRFDRRLKVEIRAVNHRYSDVTIKMPRFLNPLEDKVRRRLAEDIVRGKVDVWVNFESFAQRDVAANVNNLLADAYIEALSGLSSRYGFGPLQSSPALELLARNPDIITLDKFDASLQNDSDEIWEVLKLALNDALVDFNQMRVIEGQAMVENILSKHTVAEEIVKKIVERAPIAQNTQFERYKERIAEVVARLGHAPDDARIITELAILADKGCINEEIARLESHLAQLYTMLHGSESNGRKLDFLIQELNREINTIGSKSGDIALSALVVDLKSTVEKMREQVQNIE